MKKLASLLSLLLLISCCEQPATTDKSGPFVGVDLTKLSGKDRKIIQEASEDFHAVLARKRPLHAKPDLQSPVPADGGTSFWIGDGYRLTILESLSSFGDYHGIAYGPIITFEQQFAPGNTQEISDIRIYPHD